MTVPNRNYSSPSYRYGFNGKEKDDNFKGNNNSYDFGARMYDPRIGRWLKPDNLESQMPDWSPYSYSFNNPILLIDPDGNRPILPPKWVVDIMQQISPNFYNALYGANNSSPKQFYEWAK